MSVCRHSLLYLFAGTHRDLHSFPTRRSSDLWMLVAMMVVVNFGLYTAFRAGLNRKFTDPNLTWAQVRIGEFPIDRKSTRLNSSHTVISYAVFCLKKKKNQQHSVTTALPIRSC